MPPFAAVLPVLLLAASAAASPQPQQGQPGGEAVPFVQHAVPAGAQGGFEVPLQVMWEIYVYISFAQMLTLNV